MFQTLAQLRFLIKTHPIGLAGTYGYVAPGNLLTCLINIEHRSYEYIGIILYFFLELAYTMKISKK